MNSADPEGDWWAVYVEVKTRWQDMRSSTLSIKPQYKLCVCVYVCQFIYLFIDLSFVVVVIRSAASKYCGSNHEGRYIYLHCPGNIPKDALNHIHVF